MNGQQTLEERRGMQPCENCGKKVAGSAYKITVCSASCAYELGLPVEQPGR